MEYKLNIKKNTCSQRLGNCSEFRMMTMYSYANAIFDHHETLKFGLSAFISSVGGNLGLFLGFSLLGTLFAIKGYVFDQILKRSKESAVMIVKPPLNSRDIVNNDIHHFP